MSEDRLAQIEKYVCNEMAVAEKRQFEREMAVDAELRADVKIFMALRDAVLEKEKDEKDAVLKRSLQLLSADFFLDDTTDENTRSLYVAPVKKMRRWKMLAAAAIVTGIIILSAVWFMKGDENQPRFADSEKTGGANKEQRDKNLQPAEKATAGEKPARGKNKEPNAELLYAQYYQRDAIPAKAKDELALGYNLYAAGDIGNARAFFEKAKQDDHLRSDDTNKKQEMFHIDYYIAQCFMAEGKINDAISNLKSALNKSPNDSLTAKTQWYLALAYLKNNDTKSAADLLQKLTNKATPTPYRINAENLLTELEK